MVGGNWLNADNLYLQFGTTKAVAEVGGEFLTYGPNRVVEVLIDLTKLTATAAIQSNTTFFGSPSAGQMYIEKVELVAETAAASGTSFSVGLIQMDRATIPTNYSTAFVNALDGAAGGNLDTAGSLLVLTDDSTGAGGLIGSSPANATGPYYITALAAGTYTTGSIRVRVYYHGIGTITY